VPEGEQIKIGSVSSGKVLQANGAGDESAVGQGLSKEMDDADQRWWLIPVAGVNHQYRIHHVGSGMVLEVTGESHEDRARIRLGKDTSGAHQRWRLIPVGDADHEYAIVSVNSGKAIDLWDASQDDDAEIAQNGYWHGPQQRWRLRTPDAATTSRAILTIVRNEQVFLPIWLNYYSKFFKAEDIYVLDHQSTDGSTEGPGFVRIPVSQPAFGVGWQRDVQQRYQHELIDHYDVVLCTDVDEIVAPDPRYGDLGDYLNRFDQEFVTCQGYEVLHSRDDEPPLDRAKPVLSQRSMWYPNPLYCKPLLARVPMLWHGGFHERVDGRKNPDPHLYLIHLHRMDYDICLARHQERGRFPYAQMDLDQGWNYQNRITEPTAFSSWFYHDSCCSGVPIQPQSIPSYWREVV
jgi:hypothetical protein